MSNFNYFVVNWKKGNVGENWIKRRQIFSPEYECKNTVCKMAAISFGCDCFNSLWPSCLIWQSNTLTHWGQMTHTCICVSKLTRIGSDNSLSPGRDHAIIWTFAGIMLIGSLGTNFSEIVIEIHPFSSKYFHLKMSSAKWRPLWLGLDFLTLVVLFSAGHLQADTVLTTKM